MPKRSNYSSLSPYAAAADSSTWDGENSYQNGGDENGYYDNDGTADESIPMQDAAHLNPPKASSFDSSTSFFRSEEMALCQLFLQSESAYTCVSELGELGLVQFRDLNPDINSFQRKFVNEVRRCDEMERKLKFLDRQIKSDIIPMIDFDGDVIEAPQPREMIDLEATLDKLEHELLEVNQNAEQLRRNYLELTELKHVLRKTQYFFEEQDTEMMSGNLNQHQQLISSSDDQSMEGGGASGGLNLGFIAGVISRERLPSFERMLWRACRGNVFLRQAEIEDTLEDPEIPKEGKIQSGSSSASPNSTDDGPKQLYKSVFVIFFQGDELKVRVRKICEGFRATIYPCPEEANERREMAVGVMQRLEDLNTVLSQTNDHRQRVLVAAAKNVKMWFVKVRKIKAIYFTMNLFNIDVTQKCLIGECWMPTSQVDTIQEALTRGNEKSGSNVAPILNQMVTHESPPTHFTTNKFTSAFQELVSSYGVASYRESNPAAFSIITFPFLFSVMFGDLGHGCIMLGFGLYMCLKEKQLAAQKIQSEIWKIFFAGRYLITLMAIFSIYAGLLYNDVFSKSLNMFGSSWHVHQSTDAILHDEKDMISPKQEKGWYGSPYPIGVDPIWQVSENKIVFLNAFKMKLSIILGVIHMIFGICLSLGNDKHFGHFSSIFVEFIPQLTFLSSLFGYMALLMFHKWTAYGADSTDLNSSERCAPSILITFINMFLFKSNVKPDEKCESGYMFSGQKGIQHLLVVIALFTIPVMLFGKPLLERREAAARPKKSTSECTDDNNDSTPSLPEFNFGETMILQAIHTIEFVLSSVSHTASYLRLWALSLAHAQLSEVLWNMVLRIGLSIHGWYGGIILWLIFAFWAVCTVAILCLMEGMSAFLHTLRLHWIEFQSKFYKGQGYQFIPFSFHDILQAADETYE